MNVLSLVRTMGSVQRLFAMETSISRVRASLVSSRELISRLSCEALFPATFRAVTCTMCQAGYRHHCVLFQSQLCSHQIKCARTCFKLSRINQNTNQVDGSWPGFLCALCGRGNLFCVWCARASPLRRRRSSLVSSAE